MISCIVTDSSLDDPRSLHNGNSTLVSRISWQTARGSTCEDISDCRGPVRAFLFFSFSEAVGSLCNAGLEGTFASVAGLTGVGVLFDSADLRLLLSLIGKSSLNLSLRALKEVGSDGEDLSMGGTFTFSEGTMAGIIG